MNRISELVINARWRLFGHTFRLNIDAPARKAMATISGMICLVGRATVSQLLVFFPMRKKLPSGCL